MKKELNKPVVKLLTLWMLDDNFEHRFSSIPDHYISGGIWEARGVEVKDGTRIYSMVCLSPNRPDLAKGTVIKMDEIMLIELCHEVKIVKQPKYKSLIEKQNE